MTETLGTMGIGERIASRMQHLGLSRAELARRVGVSDSAVTNWIRGTNIPAAERRKDIAKALDVTMAFLAKGEPQQTEAQREEALDALAEAQSDLQALVVEASDKVREQMQERLAELEQENQQLRIGLQHAEAHLSGGNPLPVPTGEIVQPVRLAVTIEIAVRIVP